MQTSTDVIELAVGLIIIMAILAGLVIVFTKETEDREIIKIRFAAVTFTGILTLFVFISLMYISDDKEGAGKEIFDKGLTAMFTLAGTVVGYLFGSSSKKD